MVDFWKFMRWHVRIVGNGKNSVLSSLFLARSGQKSSGNSSVISIINCFGFGFFLGKKSSFLDVFKYGYRAPSGSAPKEINPSLNGEFSRSVTFFSRKVKNSGLVVFYGMHLFFRISKQNQGMRTWYLEKLDSLLNAEKLKSENLKSKILQNSPISKKVPR